MQVHDWSLDRETRPLAKHRSGSLVLTCAACGCRLTARQSIPDGGGWGPDVAWRHFEGRDSKVDARGCRVECADLPHAIGLAATDPAPS